MMESKTLVIGAGVAIGALMLLSNRSGGATSNLSATLASQQIATQNDTALGLANIQANAANNAAGFALGGVKLQAQSDLMQHALMFLSADSANTASIVAHAQDVDAQSNATALAFSAHVLDTAAASDIAKYTLDTNKQLGLSDIASKNYAIKTSYQLGTINATNQRLLGTKSLDVTEKLGMTTLSNEKFLGSKTLDVNKFLGQLSLIMQDRASDRGYQLGQRQLSIQQDAQSNDFMSGLLGWAGGMVNPLMSPSGPAIVQGVTSMGNNAISSGSALGASMMQSGGGGGGGGSSSGSSDMMGSIMKMAPMIMAMFA